MNGSIDALNAANARVGEAERTSTRPATTSSFTRSISPTTRSSRRPSDASNIASPNVGEVLPAGGKVFTMLDISDVYMDIYLPTVEAGLRASRVRREDHSRRLSAIVDTGAYVSFVATQAQFTPKAVETKSERDKLMFRVKVRVDKDLLLAHAEHVRTGLPGVLMSAWIRRSHGRLRLRGRPGAMIAAPSIVLRTSREVSLIYGRTRRWTM